MEDKNKHKPAGAEDLFRIIDGLPAAGGHAELDEFEREAMEGLKLVKDRSRIDRINERIDEQLKEKKKDRGIIFWISAAASLVFIVGLIYLIAPQLEKNSVAAAEGKSKETLDPQANSDYKLTDTRMEEVDARSDTVKFTGEEVLERESKKIDEVAAVNENERNENYLRADGDGKDVKNFEAIDKSVNESVQVDDITVAKENPSFANNVATSNVGPGYYAADSFSTVVGTTSTTSANGVSGTGMMNQTYQTSLPVVQEKEKLVLEDQQKQQKYIQQSYKDANTPSTGTTTTGNTYGVNNNNGVDANGSYSDTTVGFRNAIAYDNTKGKKKVAEKRNKSNENVSTKSSMADSGEKDKDGSLGANAGGMPSLGEIVLAESLKKTEAKDDKPANGGTFGNTTLTEYPGGFDAMQKFFRDNIKKTAGFTGQVLARFTVNKDGSISGATIISGIKDCDECSKEVLRVIKMMPKWKPATSAGKPISVTYNLPVRF